VAWDDNGAGVGSLIAISEGAEATQPFRPELKPVDAYASAILDEIHLNPEP
jgi:ethanolamine utilization protein EutN